MDGWQALADDHGIVAAADAFTIGLTQRDLSQLVRAEQVVRVERGWFALPEVLTPADGSPWQRRRLIHQARTWALVRAYAGRAVASHHSGLVLHDLPAFAADLGQVHLTRTADTQSRRRRGLTLHQAIPTLQTPVSGVLDPAVCVVQTGVVNGTMAGLVAADAALHRQLVTVADIGRATDIALGARNSRLRNALTLADARAESPGETRLRLALRMMGFEVEPQIRLTDGLFTAIVDFLVAGVVVVEFDGFVKYGRTRAFSQDATAADLVTAEKVREDRIRDLGHPVVRVIWSDFQSLPQIRRRVTQALGRVDLDMMEARRVSG